MPYKDLEKRRKVSRVSMGNKRKGLTGVNIGEGYPPYVYALADKVKRAKLRAICNGFKSNDKWKHFMDEVYFGVYPGKYPVSLSFIDEKLGAF